MRCILLAFSQRHPRPKMESLSFRVFWRKSRTDTAYDNKVDITIYCADESDAEIEEEGVPAESADDRTSEASCGP